MERPPIFLCPMNSAYWLPIEDRLKYEGLTSRMLPHYERIIEDLPSEGPCVVVTESAIAGDGEIGAPAHALLEGCRKKNPECKVILYTGEPYNITTTEFDAFVNAFDPEPKGYDLLFDKIKEYSQ